MSNKNHNDKRQTRKNIKTPRTHRTHRTHRTPRTHIIDYPLYNNNNKYTYKLNVRKIYNIVKNMKSQLQIYNKPPNNYSNYPPNKFKTLDIKNNNNNNNNNDNNNNNNNNKYYIIKSSWNDNLELNKLTDYFTEKCRIQCTFKKNISQLEYWNKNQSFILSNIKKKHQQPTYENIHEEMYLYNKSCNNFRITVCLEVLKLFKPTKWLDISAGWGDRLISATLYDNLTNKLELYCGVDPNPCLHPYYQDIINTFTEQQDHTQTPEQDHTQNHTQKQIHNKYILIKDGFETAQLPKTKFDLVFSSPPFFDLEIYSKSISNSFNKYNSEEQWFNGFLMPSLYKANEYLSLNGYLILYLGEAHGTHYIPKMCKILNNMLYNIGMLYYTDGKKIREFYCWQKRV